MKPSLSLLPFLAALTLTPAPACGPFFKATLFSPWSGHERILLAPPVADVLGEILSASGAPVLPVDETAADSRPAAALPDGLTISEDGLSGGAWDVLQRDLKDLQEALAGSDNRMTVLVSYAQSRRAGLMQVPESLDDAAKPTAALSTAWPKELPAEFRLYAEGAVHFQQGKKAEAAATWEKLLALPAEQRKYRSTWAAWMLARLAFKDDPTTAVKRFQQIRQEAKTGKDSLGRAAASLGWEALALEGALKKTPDVFSVESAARLVWLLGQHAKAGGGEPYFLSGTHYATNQELAVVKITKLAREWMADPAKAKACAASPYLRQVLTASLLPISRSAPLSPDAQPAQDPAEPVNPSRQWFAALESVDAAGAEDLGDRLAWAAYESGDYTQAAAWLKRAKDSPMTHWLRAKQALQAGEMKEAATHLAAAAPGFEIKEPRSDIHEDYGGYPERASELQREQFAADVGMVKLALNDFPGSLDALTRSGFWQDAAYVVENVVTAEEAIKYAVKWPLEADFKGKAEALPSPMTVEALTSWVDGGGKPRVEGEPASETVSVTLIPEDYSDNSLLHDAIARRLAREDNTKVSREFLPTHLRPVLDLFLKHRATAQNKDLPKATRAAAYWKAALIHRYAGMELWGYEGFPDNASTGGAFDAEPVRSYREGTYVPPEGGPADVIFPAPTDAEKARLKESAPRPGKRFNYRYHAYALARQGFDLMPDNSNELALMLNLTGWWFAKFDEEAARRSLAELQRRCPQTALAKEAKVKNWVVNVSAEQEASIKKLD